MRPRAPVLVVGAGPVGLVAAITTNIPYLNWYSFPLDYTLAYSFIELAGYFVAGLVLAAILKPGAVAT